MEAVDPTLFPRTLLPLIKFLLASLHPSSPHGAKDPQEHLDRSELARQVVWACMVEDPRLFLRPLFNQFSMLHSTSSEKNKHSNIEHLMVNCYCSCCYVVVAAATVVAAVVVLLLLLLLLLQLLLLQLLLLSCYSHSSVVCATGYLP